MALKERHVWTDQPSEYVDGKNVICNFGSSWFDVSCKKTLQGTGVGSWSNLINPGVRLRHNSGILSWHVFFNDIENHSCHGNLIQELLKFLPKVATNISYTNSFERTLCLAINIFQRLSEPAWKKLHFNLFFRELDRDVNKLIPKAEWMPHFLKCLNGP